MGCFFFGNNRAVQQIIWTDLEKACESQYFIVRDKTAALFNSKDRQITEIITLKL